MKYWTNKILKRGSINLASGNEGEISITPFPDWIGFLLYLGIWMRNNEENNRNFLFIMLPSRICCSAILGIGGLISTLQGKTGTLTIDEFMRLDDDTEIFLMHPDKKKKRGVCLKGTVRPVQEMSFGNEKIYCRKFNMEVKKNKKFKQYSLTIHQGNFEKYKISLFPHHHPKTAKKVVETFEFFNLFSSKGRVKKWLLSNSTECRIVTTKAAWRRQAEDSFFAVNDKPISVYDLLLIGSKRTEIVSPKSINAENEIALTIFDGPDSLRRLHKVTKGNAIVLLERAEYDSGVESVVKNLISYRSSYLPDTPHELNKNLPAGVELMLFSV